MNNTLKKLLSSLLVILMLTGCMTIRAEEDPTVDEGEQTQTVENGEKSEKVSEEGSADNQEDTVIFEAEVSSDEDDGDDPLSEEDPGMDLTDQESGITEDYEQKPDEPAEMKEDQDDFMIGEVTSELEYAEDGSYAVLVLSYDGDGELAVLNAGEYLNLDNLGFSLNEEKTEENRFCFVSSTNNIYYLFYEVTDNEEVIKDGYERFAVTEISEKEAEEPVLRRSVKSSALRSAPSVRSSQSMSIEYTAGSGFDWTIPASVNLNNGSSFGVSLSEPSLSSGQVINVTMSSANSFKLVGVNSGHQYSYTMTDENDNTVNNGFLVLSYGGEGEDNLANTLTVDTSNVTSVVYSDTYSDTITFDASLQQQTVLGVRHSTSSSSTAWERTGDSIGLSFTPSTATVTGSSDFDSFYPYSGIVRETLSTGDVMVKIPKFYYRRYIESGYEYIEISDQAGNGFELHPAFDRVDGVRDYIYVGAYKTSSNNRSVSGASPQVSQTRATMRTNAGNKGSGWSLIDISTANALQMLILVECANADVQTTVGNGYSSGSQAYTTGSTDSLVTSKYYTGTTGASITTNADVLWRGIEGFWGNVWEWTDGLNFNGGTYYICNNPAYYADDTSSHYTALSYTGSTGWSQSYITAMGYDSNNTWAMMPTAAGSGNATTYYADAIWSSTGWRVFLRGGDFWDGTVDGLFASAVDDTSSGTRVYIGSRLLYLPQ